MVRDARVTPHARKRQVHAPWKMLNNDKNNVTNASLP
jgi:hypothetical protein